MIQYLENSKAGKYQYSEVFLFLSWIIQLMTDISEIWAAQLLKMSHDIRQADKGNIITPNNMWRSDGNDGGGGDG